MSSTQMLESLWKFQTFVLSIFHIFIISNLIPILLFSRRYSQDSTSLYYTHEKIYGTHGGPTPDLPGWDNNDGEHAIPVNLFSKHVSELHMDQVSLPLFT